MSIKKKPQKSDLASKLEGKQKPQESGNFKISLEHYDPSQPFGSSFADWEKGCILAHTLKVLHGYSHRSLISQVDNSKFTIYGDFPPAHITKFTHPKHVPPDAKWARIHITGSVILAGHVSFFCW